MRRYQCFENNRILPWIGTLGCEMVDLDSMVLLTRAREAMGPSQVLAGNVDPVKVLRNGTPESIAAAIAECHRQAGAAYIVGAGCEVPRDTPPENLRALGDYARSVA